MRNVRGIRFAAAAAIALIAGIAIISQVFAQMPTVVVSSATINPGASGTLNLTARDIGAPGLGAWEIGITYDASLVTATACAPQAGSVCNPNFASNRVQVVGANPAGLVGTTSLANITFRCNGEGTTELNVVIDVFSDATTGGPRPINPGINAGRITCEDSVGLPAVPTTQPRPTAAPGDDTDTDDDVDDEPQATAVSTLPSSGSGTGSSSITSWLIAALATLGLVTLVSLGASRMFAQHTDSRD